MVPHSMRVKSATRDGIAPPARRPAVSVAALLGQGSRQRPNDSNQPLGAILARHLPGTLAEALAASLPKSLQDALAEGLGITADIDAPLETSFDRTPMSTVRTRPDHLAPDGVRFVSEATMEATKDLMRAHGWHSRAWH